MYMKRSHRWIILSWALVSSLCCCGKSDDGGEEKNTTPAAPTAITLTPASLDAAAEGGALTVTIKAPARPRISNLPSWITVTDGTFKDFQITMTLNIVRNDAYETRSADLTVTASGAADVTLRVTQGAREAITDPSLPDNAAVRRQLELGIGWNMGNQLDAFANGVANETCWGNKAATQATFDGVKAAGFMSVRIPVTWMGHIGEAPDYLIEEAWMERVAEVVGYAKTAGLNVILNTHHDEDHNEGHWQNLKGAVDNEDTNTQVKQEIASVWTQIANRFKDEGDYLMLESFNELIYGGDWSINGNAEKKCGVINEWNQVFVDAVRATGGNNATRWLGVPGYAANPGYLKYLTVPNDPAGKIMVAFHCYDPYDYTIGDKQLANWGHSGNAYPRGEEEIKELFNGLYKTYVANNIPIYMGEFGCSFRSKSDATRWNFFLYYLEYVTKAARVFGIPAFLWDNGAEGSGKERHGYINHGTGAYMGSSKEAVEVIVKAWTSTDASYTLQSVYDSAPSL